MFREELVDYYIGEIEDLFQDEGFWANRQTWTTKISSTMSFAKNILVGASWAIAITVVYLPIGETVTTANDQVLAERWSLVSLALGAALVGDPIKLNAPYVVSAAVLLAGAIALSGWRRSNQSAKSRVVSA